MVRNGQKSPAQTLSRPAKTIAPALSEVGRQISHGRTTVVFTRDFAAGGDALWAMVTQPERLRLWAPFTADRDLSQVGRVVLTMLGDGDSPDVDLPSVVLVADSPTLLEYSWASDMVAWHLTAIGSGSRLTLHQTLADATMASAVAAGWHLCFDVAAAILVGSPSPPIRGKDALNHGWSELNERYAAALGVEPSRID
jgi:uncharacterized protein YndB with AHSA1/START domain